MPARRSAHGTSPPLGVVGTLIDRALLYRVAEATLKDFLDRVGDAITARPVEAFAGVLAQR